MSEMRDSRYSLMAEISDWALEIAVSIDKHSLLIALTITNCSFREGNTTFRTEYLSAQIFSIVDLSKILFFHSSNKLERVYK